MKILIRILLTLISVWSYAYIIHVTPSNTLEWTFIPLMASFATSLLFIWYKFIEGDFK
jgi:hypothetical protein